MNFEQNVCVRMKMAGLFGSVSVTLRCCTWMFYLFLSLL